MPPLKAITIEINSECNRKCSYCPNHNHTRERAFLERELFHKIVAELHAMNFKGRFAFNLYNEPLLDKRLPGFIEYVRRELPAAFVLIDTNGDMLDLPAWEMLRAAGLDFAHITRHDGEIGENIREILHAGGPEANKHVCVRTSINLNNRAGLVAHGAKAALPLAAGCPRPYYQLCINCAGKAVLCCNDYLGSVEIGDARKETVPALWGSRLLGHYRRKLFFRDRSGLKLCSVCDVAQDPIASPFL